MDYNSRKLVPYIPPAEYDNVANEFLERFYPDALKNPMPVPIAASLFSLFCFERFFGNRSSGWRSRKRRWRSLACSRFFFAVYSAGVSIIHHRPFR